MKLSWIAIFLLVFFLINVARFVMAYFGKKLSGVPQVPVLSDLISAEDAEAVAAVSKDKIAKVLMDVVEKKLFPDITNLYDGIKTQEQLDEFVEKVTTALEGVAVAVGGDRVEEMDAEADKILAETGGAGIV